MTAIFPGLLCVLFVACLAFLYGEGLWSNAVRLINVFFAAMLAVNFWEPLTRMAENSVPSFTYMWDFAVLWLTFAVCLLVFQIATRSVSKVKVRFKKIVEQIGSLVFAALIGWVMVCFTTMSLHTAPLGERFLWKGFDPDQRMLFGTAPDRQWLGFVNLVSRGSLRCWTSNEFDPDLQFIDTYSGRRADFEAHVAEKKAFRVSGQIEKR